LKIVDRAQRLKDARVEALQEIEELKKRKSEELLEHEKKVIMLGFIAFILILYFILYFSLFIACWRIGKKCN
jgi:CHASE3 domain sensor protein